MDDDLAVVDEIAQTRLDWKISEFMVNWITHRRDIRAEYPHLFPCDVLTWKLRVSGMLLFGVLQIVVCIGGTIVYSVSKRPPAAILAATNVGVVLTSFIVLKIGNMFELFPQKQSISVVCYLLVFTCLVGPGILHYLLGGMHWSVTGILIWNLGAPLGSLFLLPNPTVAIKFLMVARVLLDLGVIALGRLAPVTVNQPNPIVRVLGISVANTLCPIAVTYIFRRQCQEHHWRALALEESQEQLEAQQRSTRWLIFSMVPPQRAEKLKEDSPELWHVSPADSFYDCSILQVLSCSTLSSVLTQYHYGTATTMTRLYPARLIFVRGARLGVFTKADGMFADADGYGVLDANGYACTAAPSRMDVSGCTALFTLAQRPRTDAAGSVMYCFAGLRAASVCTARHSY
eukprot:2893777-Rhodomonas_salina.1